MKTTGGTLWPCLLFLAGIWGPAAIAVAQNEAAFFVPSDDQLEAIPQRILPEGDITAWDTDSDGMPDGWEQWYFQELKQDADDDPDRDGLTNLIEYQLGTDPRYDNVRRRDGNNGPPVLNILTSAASAKELAMFAVLGRARDPEGERVRFAVEYGDIGTGSNDEPEFFTDPAEPNAHLYWIPSEGRSREEPYQVTFCACDESDNCARQTISFPVMPSPAERVIFLNTGSINYHSSTPPTITLGEGEHMVVESLEVSTVNPTACLRVVFEPPLGDTNDLPKITRIPDTKTTRFRVDWIPDFTRGGADRAQQSYTIALEVYCDGRRSSAPAHLRRHVFNVVVRDMPIVVPPILAVAAGETLEFDFDAGDWNGGEIDYSVSPVETILPPNATLDPTSGHFKWVTSSSDAGKSYRMQVATRAMTREENPVLRSATSVYHLRVLPPPGDMYEGNLVINPHASHDERDEHWHLSPDGNPDGWKRFGVFSSDHDDSAPSYLGWDPAGGSLRSANNVTTGTDTRPFGWRQELALTPHPSIAVPDGTIYEFAASYRADDVRLRIDRRGMATREQCIGLSLSFKDQWGRNLEYAHWSSLRSYAAGFDDDSWRAEDGCYHAIDEAGCDLPMREYKCYAAAPTGARRAVIITENPTPGLLTVSHVSLRPVPGNPIIPAFKPSGGVIQPLRDDKEGSPVFAIGLNHDTPIGYDGNPLPLKAMRRLGFNLMSLVPHRSAEHIASGMYAYGKTNMVPYAWNLCGNPTTRPACEPHTHGGFFPGAGLDAEDRIPGVETYYGLDINRAMARTLAEQTKRGLRVILLDGPDESNFRLRMDGAPPELRELTYTADQLKRIIDRPYMLNVIFRDDYEDIDDAHAKLADVISFTWNLQPAYTNQPAAYGPARFQQAKLCRTGEAVRRWQAATKRTCAGDPRVPKPILGFGTAVREWGSIKQFAPFHLQRFAVYNQIANGVTGIRFYGTNAIGLTLPPSPQEMSQDCLADRYQWSQIQELVAEVALLSGVYAEPEYLGGWSTTAVAPIEAMLKACNGRFYLIATNPSERPLGDVQITLPASVLPNGIIRVIALFEHDRTIAAYPAPAPADAPPGPDVLAAVRQRGATRTHWTRQVSVEPGAVSFVDSFIDYAVHVYEIVPAVSMVEVEPVKTHDQQESTIARRSMPQPRRPF